MSQPLFVLNKIYRRSEIHDIYGGNRQGGISASAKFPYVFIFSGKAGHQHGYKDQWENENIFSYTGEGQLNDMKFIKGNLALRDHLKTGKRIFLFMQEIKAFVKFEAELELIDFDFFNGLDREGKERIAIKFFFKRLGVELKNYPEQIPLSLVGEDPIKLETKNIPNETERKGLITSRIGQGAYRKSVLYRWEFKCAITNYPRNEILIASHILPWKDSTNTERLDVDNGILFSPTYDALFDKHLISFENNGKIILSDSLAQSTYKDIGVTGHETVKSFTTGNHFYLEKHRERLREKL